MAQPVVTINRKAVYSDKRMSNVVNSRVTFSDGSWCDVATGEVVNKGPGYINIGAPVTAGSGEKTTYGPKLFSTQTLHVSNVNADVEVVIIGGDEMSLIIDGIKSEVDAIEVNASGGALSIQGKAGVSDVQTTNIVFGGSSSISISNGTVNIGRGSFSISTSEAKNDTKITVGVPKGSAVHVGGVRGNVVIGDTEGPLQANVVGACDVKAGKVGIAALSIRGSGDISVDSVNGSLMMNVQGSGDILVRNGSVNQLSVNVMGSGDARFDGEATEANLSVMGSGDIAVKYVKNKPVTNVMGSGRIGVGNW